MRYSEYGVPVPESKEEEEKLINSIMNSIKEYNKIYSEMFEWTGVEAPNWPNNGISRVRPMLNYPEIEKPKYGKFRCVLENDDNYVVSLVPWSSELWSIAGGKLYIRGDCKGRIKEISSYPDIK